MYVSMARCPACLVLRGNPTGMSVQTPPPPCLHVCAITRLGQAMSMQPSLFRTHYHHVVPTTSCQRRAVLISPEKGIVTVLFTSPLSGSSTISVVMFTIFIFTIVILLALQAQDAGRHSCVNLPCVSVCVCVSEREREREKRGREIVCLWMCGCVQAPPAQALLQGL